MLATKADVEQRLGRALDTEEETRVDGLIDEASALVTGWCRRAIPDPAPKAVMIVVSRMVARVFDSPAEMVGVESTQVSAGSFQLSRNYAADSSTGGPWLARADRIMLRPWRGGVVNVSTW